MLLGQVLFEYQKWDDAIKSFRKCIDVAEKQLDDKKEVQKKKRRKYKTKPESGLLIQKVKKKGLWHCNSKEKPWALALPLRLFSYILKKTIFDILIKVFAVFSGQLLPII